MLHRRQARLVRNDKRAAVIWGSGYMAKEMMAKKEKTIDLPEGMDTLLDNARRMDEERQERVCLKERELLMARLASEPDRLPTAWDVARIHQAASDWVDSMRRASSEISRALRGMPLDATLEILGDTLFDVLSKLTPEGRVRAMTELLDDVSYSIRMIVPDGPS